MPSFYFPQSLEFPPRGVEVRFKALLTYVGPQAFFSYLYQQCLPENFRPTGMWESQTKEEEGIPFLTGCEKDQVSSHPSASDPLFEDMFTAFRKSSFIFLFFFTSLNLVSV